MPEGPEVRVVADFISDFKGVNFTSSHIIENTSKLHRFSHNPPAGFESIRSGFLLNDVMTKGKLIILNMADVTGDVKYALVTLGMSGTWVRDGMRHKHARLSFIYDTGDLTFINPRCFGTFKLVSQHSYEKKLKSIGFDLLASPMSTDDWLLLKQHRIIKDMPVGEALMQQRLFSGIGNIYKSEIIYECMLDPRAIVGSLTDDQWVSINLAAHKILRTAYENRGSTVSTFSSDGEHGSNQDFLKVYGRENAPEGPVISFEQGGRTTWWCPNRVASLATNV